jgi:hypothetical protein
MGQPKEVQTTNIGGNYNWGEFGSATPNEVIMSPTIRDNIRTAQSGIGQYLNELINPSYNNESFMARQAILDAKNRQYANQLGAQALARGARGSATQSILNSVMANRNMDMRNAMANEDSRVRNVLSSLSGIEGNYFNQANTMANNILDRAKTDAGVQNAANAANTEAYNQWRNNMINTGVKIAATMIGGGAGYMLADQLGNQGVTNTFAGGVDNTGMYGQYNPYDPNF